MSIFVASSFTLLYFTTSIILFWKIPVTFSISPTYVSFVEPITYLAITVYLYHYRSMHFGAFSFKKANETVK